MKLIDNNDSCDSKYLYYNTIDPNITTVTFNEHVTGIVNCFEYQYYQIEGM
jgi:hypothetical protein